MPAQLCRHAQHRAAPAKNSTHQLAARSKHLPRTYPDPRHVTSCSCNHPMPSFINQPVSSCCSSAAALIQCTDGLMCGTAQHPTAAAYSSLARALSRLDWTATSLLWAVSLSFLRRARSRSSTYQVRRRKGEQVTGGGCQYAGRSQLAVDTSSQRRPNCET